MSKKKLFFDFEDGRGEVEAHQHVNPDKSLGGWVENNCEVSDNSFISSNSRVYNNSSVDNSRVDNSSVYNSRVDNSRVYNLKIKHTKQVFSQSPIGSRNDRATAIWDLENKSIVFIAGCFNGNEKEFQKAVLDKHGHSSYGKEYLTFIQNAKSHFEIWMSELESLK